MHAVDQIETHTHAEVLSFGHMHALRTKVLFYPWPSKPWNKARVALLCINDKCHKDVTIILYKKRITRINIIKLTH